jgi:hypothetical protein
VAFSYRDARAAEAFCFPVECLADVERCDVEVRDERTLTDLDLRKRVVAPACL